MKKETIEKKKPQTEPEEEKNVNIILMQKESSVEQNPPNLPISKQKTKTLVQIQVNDQENKKDAKIVKTLAEEKPNKKEENLKAEIKISDKQTKTEENASYSTDNKAVPQSNPVAKHKKSSLMEKIIVGPEIFVQLKDEKIYSKYTQGQILGQGFY
jgi:ribosomal protein S16